MAKIKQKTVNGETLELHRKKSPVKGERNVYEIRKSSGEIVEEDAGTRKGDALKEFEDTVNIFSEDADDYQESRGQNGFLDQGSIF